MARVKYTVNARRSGAWWAIEIEELGGVFSQARRLDQVEAMARDAIALFQGVELDSFEIEVRQKLDDQLNELVIAATAAKARAAGAQAEASSLLREAARELTESGMTIRDVGRLLGITHQRVAQLLASQPQAPYVAAMADALGPADREYDV